MRPTRLDDDEERVREIMRSRVGIVLKTKMNERFKIDLNPIL